MAGPAEGRRMGRVQIDVKVDEAPRNAAEGSCKPRGLVMKHVVQEALLDRLEELEDIEDLKKIRHEPTRPLADLLRELRLDGGL